jgi:citrate synthase
VARTVTSTGAPPMTSLAAGVATFGPLHGAVVTAAMRLIAEPGEDLDLGEWARRLYERERAAGRRIPGVGHRWHSLDRRAERLLDLVADHGDRGRYIGRVRALADVVGAHAGHSVAVNVDGALAAALSSLGVDPAYGDFVFAISRSAGLAAHIVEESVRERPMRFIDPTAVTYDGPPPGASPAGVPPRDGDS